MPASCAVLVVLNRQSPDIAQGVNENDGAFTEQGAGDQGLTFGYACDQTERINATAHCIVASINSTIN